MCQNCPFIRKRSTGSCVVSSDRFFGATNPIWICMYKSRFVHDTNRVQIQNGFVPEIQFQVQIQFVHTNPNWIGCPSGKKVNVLCYIYSFDFFQTSQNGSPPIQVSDFMIFMVFTKKDNGFCTIVCDTFCIQDVFRLYLNKFFRSFFCDELN